MRVIAIGGGLFPTGPVNSCGNGDDSSSRGVMPSRAARCGHDGAMPQARSIHLRRSQIIWLVAIVAVGVIVGVVAGVWLGVGAAVILLAVNEVIERVQRARR